MKPRRATALVSLLVALSLRADEPKKATTPAPPPSHIVPSPVTEKDLVAPTRKTYSGPLAVGYDLMSISIGERITIEKRVVPVE